MSKSVDLKTYYSLYSAIQDLPRFTAKQISSALNIGGRGQKYSTVTDHIRKLYEREISLRPNLVLRTFENYYTKGYFLTVKNPENITSAFYSLTQNPHLTYMLLLSGRYDFFVTSKYDLTFGSNLKIAKKSISYTPIYTNPLGWNHEVKDMLWKIASSTLTEGKIEREMEDWLPWEDIHFRIYDIMKNNVQIPFSTVAEETGFSSITVKKYFYETVLPYCNIAHYFFPKGYNHYSQAVVTIETDFEEGLVGAFSKLPCTTYVFPLEEELLVGIFHEGIQDVMFTMKKLEEKGFIKKHLLLVPLYWE